MTASNVMLYESPNHAAFNCQCGSESRHRSFRCPNKEPFEGRMATCGCNVFTRLDESRYRCNACQVIYIAE